MARLTTDDRKEIMKAAKSSDSEVHFVGENRTVIDKTVYYGSHDAIKKLKGS